MATSSLPLYPTDDGWPYPDASAWEPADGDEVDLDALEVRVDPHLFECLDERERFAVTRRFGLTCEPASMKALARELGCTRAEAALVLGVAIDKLRVRLRAP